MQVPSSKEMPAPACDSISVRALRGAFVCLVLIFSCAAQAQAHAYVVASSPAANGTIAASPREVSVSFDEPVTIESSRALVVTGEDGRTHPCAAGARIDPDDETLVVCKLSDTLPRGAYVVSWRVTSADTHVVHGVFSFGVGVAVNGPSGEVPSIYDPSGALATVLRWLVLAGIIAVAGASVFEMFVAPGPLAPALRTWGILTALAAGLLALDVQAAAASGTDLVRALPDLPRIVAGSTWGIAWLVRTFALVSIGAFGRTRAAFSLVLAGVALLTISISGHAVANGLTSQTILPLVADWIHLAAAAIWAGGLMMFVGGPRTRESIARFSSLAIGSVAAIAVTGTYASILHVASLQALGGSLYGRIVLAKIALLLVLISFGYRHFRHGRREAARWSFGVTIVWETAVVVVVIGLSAVLTGLAPPFPYQGG
jgi:copper transport protein